MSKKTKNINDSLDNKLKEPFKMFIEGYKFTEIAEYFGIKVETVKTRIFSARKKLMDLLNRRF
jgi:RNA polymerase sigma-70 factor (ECF subfamily)